MGRIGAPDRTGGLALSRKPRRSIFASLVYWLSCMRCRRGKLDLVAAAANAAQNPARSPADPAGELLSVRMLSVPYRTPPPCDGALLQSQTEVQDPSEAQALYHTQAPAASQAQEQTQIQAQAPSQTETQAHIQVQNTFQAQVQIQTSSQTDVQVYTQTQNTFQYQAPSQAQVQAQIQAQDLSQTEFQTDIQAQNPSQAQDQNQTQIQPPSQAQIKAQTQAEAPSQVQVQTQTHAPSQAQVQVQIIAPSQLQAPNQTQTPIQTRVWASDHVQAQNQSQGQDEGQDQNQDHAVAQAQGQDHVNEQVQSAEQAQDEKHVQLCVQDVVGEEMYHRERVEKSLPEAEGMFDSVHEHTKDKIQVEVSCEVKDGGKSRLLDCAMESFGTVISSGSNKLPEPKDECGITSVASEEMLNSKKKISSNSTESSTATSSNMRVNLKLLPSRDDIRGIIAQHTEICEEAKEGDLLKTVAPIQEIEKLFQFLDDLPVPDSKTDEDVVTRETNRQENVPSLVAEEHRDTKSCPQIRVVPLHRTHTTSMSLNEDVSRRGPIFEDLDRKQREFVDVDLVSRKAASACTSKEELSNKPESTSSEQEASSSSKAGKIGFPISCMANAVRQLRGAVKDMLPGKTRRLVVSLPRPYSSTRGSSIESLEDSDGSRPRRFISSDDFVFIGGSDSDGTSDVSSSARGAIPRPRPPPPYIERKSPPEYGAQGLQALRGPTLRGPLAF